MPAADPSRLRRTLVAPLVATALLATAACGGSDAEEPVGQVVSGIEVGGEDDGLHGAVLTDPYALPEVSLTDTDGEPYALAADTDAPLTLVFFGYTQCPDICQVVMGSLASALTRLSDEEAERVEVLFVTTDPARDDASTLRAYLDRLDPSFEGLTGDLDVITTAGNALGVDIAKGERLPSGGYEVLHGTQVIGVDAEGRGTIVWTEGTSPAQFAEDVAALLGDAA
ncbi:MAG: SCO family protein [Nocardioides sp.]|nr:SCO family protein [Nocardioides sp.]